MRTSTPTERLVDIGPTSLNVRIWPGDLTFLLIHGLSSNARLWDGVAGELSGQGFGSAAVDLRSHGRSPATASGYDTATAAGDLAMLAAKLDGGPLVAVGQSWGGNVVAALGAEHPALVNGLALIDGGWLDLSSRFPSWSACAERLRPPEIDGTSVEAMRAYLAGTYPGWEPWAVEATLANMDVRDGKVYRRLSIPHHMQILRSLWDRSPLPDLARLRVPVALLPVVASDAPQDLTEDDTPFARAVTELIDVTVHPYRGGDHDLHAQQPKAVAADLIALAHRVPR
jgi:pimeloyl-ACP methyl ester carboxylesterase